MLALSSISLGGIIPVLVISSWHNFCTCACRAPTQTWHSKAWSGRAGTSHIKTAEASRQRNAYYEAIVCTGTDNNLLSIRKECVPRGGGPGFLVHLPVCWSHAVARPSTTEWKKEIQGFERIKRRIAKKPESRVMTDVGLRTQVAIIHRASEKAWARVVLPIAN